MASAATAPAWSLPPEQRQETLIRVEKTMANLAFCRGLEVTDLDATAAKLERSAYTTAQVESCTTSGARPVSETTRAYARKFASLLMEHILHVESKPEAEQGAFEPAAPTADDVVDLSTGPREFVTLELAEELLAPMLREGASVRAVKFSTKSFGEAAAHVAARGIVNCAGSLRDADISDIIAGRPEDEALRVLTILSEALTHCRLASLNISDNALGEKGVRACEAVISNPSLAGLSLQNVGCSVFACRAVNELVKGDALKKLHLYNNMSGDEGAAAIAELLTRCPAMEDFRMVSSRVGPEGGAALCEAFLTSGASSGLRSLDLHDNPYTAEVAAPLAALLSQAASLEVLNLTDAGLEDEGVAVVAGACCGGAGTPQLRELHLGLNEITAEGAEALGVALLRQGALRVLNLAENELKDTGAVCLARALAHSSSLRELDLRINQIGSTGALAVARAVSGMPALTLLALDENEISESGLVELRSIMEQAGAMDKLGSLDENMADGAEDGDVAEDDMEFEALTAAMASMST